MKKAIRLIMMLLFAAIIITVVSCETASKKEQSKAKSSTQETNKTSFTTALGTFDTEKVIMEFYEDGLRAGAIDKEYNEPYRHGDEKYFKQDWVSLIGVPNNSEAQAVYDEALRQYKKGYEEGLNF